MNVFSSVYLLSVCTRFETFTAHACSLKHQNKCWVLLDCYAKLADTVARHCSSLVDVCKRSYMLSLLRIHSETHFWTICLYNNNNNNSPNNQKEKRHIFFKE